MLSERFFFSLSLLPSFPFSSSFPSLLTFSLSSSMRYFITLSFDGSGYHGWQVQPGAVTVQGLLNQALQRLFGAEVSCVGAGRTDAGVHASKMVAHFDVPHPIDTAQTAYRLGRMLPSDIDVQRVQRVADDVHARFTATWRTYHYYVTLRKNPFRRHYAMRLPWMLDFEKMNEAARLLLDIRDFTSFAKLGGDQKTNICHLRYARWVKVEEDVWRFEISADRFLRNMVRAVVGTLIEVGRGRISPSGVLSIIAAHDRCAAGESVPACGLFLVDVGYPEAALLAPAESGAAELSQDAPQSHSS